MAHITSNKNHIPQVPISFNVYDQKKIPKYPHEGDCYFDNKKNMLNVFTKGMWVGVKYPELQTKQEKAKQMVENHLVGKRKINSEKRLLKKIFEAFDDNFKRLQMIKKCNIIKRGMEMKVYEPRFAFCGYDDKERKGYFVFNKKTKTYLNKVFFDYQSANKYAKKLERKKRNHD